MKTFANHVFAYPTFTWFHCKLTILLSLLNCRQNCFTPTIKYMTPLYKRLCGSTLWSVLCYITCFTCFVYRETVRLWKACCIWDGYHRMFVWAGVQVKIYFYYNTKIYYVPVIQMEIFDNDHCCNTIKKLNLKFSDQKTIQTKCSLCIRVYFVIFLLSFTLLYTNFTHINNKRESTKQLISAMYYYQNKVSLKFMSSTF